MHESVGYDGTGRVEQPQVRNSATPGPEAAGEGKQITPRPPTHPRGWCSPAVSGEPRPCFGRGMGSQLDKAQITREQVPRLGRRRARSMATELVALGIEQESARPGVVHGHAGAPNQGFLGLAVNL